MGRFFLPATFFVGTLVLLVVYSKGTLKRETATTSGSGKVPYMQVHQYKQETAIKMELEKDQARFRKESGAPRISNTFKDDDDDDFYEGTELSAQKNVGQDLFNDQSVRQAVTLDQKMDDFLAKKQKYDELETMKKQAYISRFREEARSMGFEVQIDENMQIISVKKINKK